MEHTSRDLEKSLTARIPDAFEAKLVFSNRRDDFGVPDITGMTISHVIRWSGVSGTRSGDESNQVS